MNRKDSFVFFIMEFCMLIGIKDNEKAEIPKRSKFITAQSTDSDCHAAFASAIKRNACFSVGSEGMPVQASLLDDPPQRVLPALFDPVFFTFVNTPH